MRHAGPTSGQILQALECASQATRGPPRNRAGSAVHDPHVALTAAVSCKTASHNRARLLPRSPLTAHTLPQSWRGKSAPTIPATPLNRPHWGTVAALSLTAPQPPSSFLLHRACSAAARSARFSPARCTAAGSLLLSPVGTASPPRVPLTIAAQAYGELLHREFLRLAKGEFLSIFPLF